MIVPLLEFGLPRATARAASCLLPALWLLLGCRQASSGAEPEKAAASVSASATAAVPSAARPRLPTLGPFDNVLFLTVDTLRADQPWTGYQKLSTPHLSRLAEQCVVYTRAYALANFTTASLNGILASRYPSELTRSSCHLGRYEIPDSLAPHLTSAGVVTFAAHGHAIFAGDAAPRLGFAEWRLINGAAGKMQTEGAVTGADIAALFSAYVEKERAATKRLFAWVHLLDPHHSYVSHAAFPARSNAPRDVYDSEVAYTDSVIGDVLQSIERAGMTKNTAIVVTADHGEAFGEHGTIYHGFSMFEEELRVPLMLCLPGVEPRKIDVPRSAIDLTPTIAELFGLKPADSWDGKSLLSDLRGPLESRPVLVDVPPAGTSSPARQAVIRDQLKVTITRGTPQVYDLASDPGEKTPLTGDAAAQAIAQARRDLQRIVSVDGAPCPSTQAK